MIRFALGETTLMSSGQPGFRDMQERLRELSAQGDPLEKLARTMDFELLPPELTAPLGTRHMRKGGRPAFDPVLKFRAVPDANTLWDFREALIASGALERLFTRLDEAITAAGYLPMAGQIVDATLLSAPASATRMRRRPASRPLKRRSKSGPTSQPARASRIPMRAGR